MAGDHEILSIENLKGYYRGTFGIVHGIDGISLSVKPGEVLGICGESGCGKSTLAELITGTPMPLLHYEEGKIILDGFQIYHIDAEVLRKEVKCKRMSYVPQASMESLNPVKKIKDFIMDVVRERTGEKPSMRLDTIKKIRTFIEDAGSQDPDEQTSREKILKFAVDHFKRVGLDEKVLNRYPHELSGGMKQRVVIAISTMWNPKLLIVDEPTSALDVSSQKLMIKMLYDLKKEGIIETILFVSHDIPTLRQLCTRCIVMYAGQIVENGMMNDIVNDPLHPYSQGLISSIVSFNPDGTRPSHLESIPGSHPDLRNPPPGCRFHPRCPKVMDICPRESPPMFEPPGKNRQVACWLFK
ncbi:MAG: ABC transporter ATP-binding protein [Candidatus Hermodarchaeota archaeon]